jgi:hypothetical protein
LAGAAGAVVALWAVLTWPEPLEERVRRIRPGMTRDEVEDLIGAPEGLTWESALYDFSDGRPVPVPGSERDIYLLDDGSVFVRFDGERATDDIRFVPNPNPPSLWDRWRRRLTW